MKRILAIASLAIALPVIPQHQAIAQSEALIQQGVRVCAANPTACALVVAGGGLLYWQWRSSHGPVLVPIPKHLRRTALSESPRREGNLRQTEVLPQQRRSRTQVPGENRVQSGDDLVNIPGEREVHTVMNSRQCDSMARQFQRQGIRLTLTRRVPTRMPGARRMTICVFEGPDAIDDRFADYRYNSRDEY